MHTTIEQPQALGDIYSYAAYARVQNPQGIGFSIEGFPAHTLTGASVHVAGIRRLTATASSPAYQTNCFVGSTHHLSAPNPAFGDTEVAYDLLTRDGALIASGTINAPPGKLVRVLDIFGAAQAPAGDYDDAQVIFSPQSSSVVEAFCTVQDNTSFSADFRIGKQFVGVSSLAVQGTVAQSPYAQDDHVNRRTQTRYNVGLTNGAGGVEQKPYVIPAGSSSNAHLVQFRNPDWVACDLLTPNLIPTTGLEMRLVSPTGTVLAGGNDVNSFAPVYLGDKYGTIVNSRYIIEVESSEVGTGVDKPYVLRCRSGSGHSIPDLVRTGGPDQF